MFRIIGADQKEYGPISTAQIRQWITDGRLNQNTQARREDGDWQTLGSFEEFADVFHPATAAGASETAASPMALGAAPIPSGSHEAALNAVKGPAIALIITASLGIAAYLLRAATLFIVGGAMFQRRLPYNVPPEMQHMMQLMQGSIGGLICLVIVAYNAFILFGAIKMMRLQNHTLAFITCIAAMLPCGCCCIFGLPFGIWGLVMLNKPEVKSQFLG